MHRLIKFRVYDKYNKRMIPHEHIECGIKNINKKGKNYNQSLIFMQYIGRNDKNDIEIYEGDICKSINHTFRVEFNSGCFKFIDVNKNKGYWTPSNSNSVTVIGNIYEDEDLLNKLDKIIVVGDVILIEKTKT